MPERKIARRGGVVRYRTITIGKGKNKKTLKVAVVRKAGRHGGHTIAYKAKGKN